MLMNECDWKKLNTKCCDQLYVKETIIEKEDLWKDEEWMKYTKDAGQVLMKESWGRVVALFAFSYEIVKLFINQGKVNQISEIQSWMELSLLKHTLWFEKQGWESFPKNEKSKFPIVIVISFLCIFIFRCLL